MKIQEIREHLARWEAASDAIAKGKSYTIDGLTYYRQDADRVREMLDYWTKRLAGALRIARGGVSVQQGATRDLGSICWKHHRGGRIE